MRSNTAARNAVVTATEVTWTMETENLILRRNMKLDDAQTDRVIQMAWEDRTTFDAIRQQFGLEPGQVIKLMRKSLKPSSFRLWRTRTTGRNTKHLSKRSFKVGRFRCKSQRG